MCTTPSTYIEGEDAIDSVEMVIKWQNDALCRAEEFGARVFEYFRFNPPPTYRIDRDVAPLKDLMAIAADKEPVMLSVVGERPALAMPRLLSNNLSHISKNNEFFTLERPEQDKLLYEFGRMAAVDVLIGNDDRFLKLMDSISDEVPAAGKINMGNVLVHLNTEKTEVREIYPIDSCPSLLLIEDEKEPIEVVDFCSIFDDGSPASIIEETSSSDSSIRCSEQTEEALHRVFQWFVKNPAEFSAQFARTWVQKVAIPEPGQLQELTERAERVFLSGIQHQLKMIKAEAETFKREVLPHTEQDDALYHAMSLIERNLRVLQESSIEPRV